MTGPPEDDALITPETPSTDAVTLAAADAARSFIPIAILSTAGRFFSMVPLYLAARVASAAPSTLRTTLAGVHSSLPETLASQLALHSALTFGGSTLPEQWGAFISTEHLPEHWPSHLPEAFS